MRINQGERVFSAGNLNIPNIFSDRGRRNLYGGLLSLPFHGVYCALCRRGRTVSVVTSQRGHYRGERRCPGMQIECELAGSPFRRHSTAVRGPLKEEAFPDPWKGFYRGVVVTFRGNPRGEHRTVVQFLTSPSYEYWSPRKIQVPLEYKS